MSNYIKNVVCPNCGSIDVKINNNGLVICQSCGGSFYVDVDSNIKASIQRLEKLKSDPERYFSSGYRYDDTYTKDEFFNNALLYLRDAYLCPAYIFEESKFSPVTKIDIPIIRAKGSATIKYSRILGYDKRIAITEHKTTKYSDGTRKHQYNTHYETKTDWIPDNGMLYGDAEETFIDPKFVEFINNQEFDDSKVSRMSESELNELKIDEEVLSNLKDRILEDVFNENITYPVDKVRDEEYSGNTKINDVSLTVVSIYSIEITVRESSFILFASTNGNPQIQRLGKLPLNDDQEDYNNQIYSIATERNSITKMPRLFRLLTLLIFTTAFIGLLAYGINEILLAAKIGAFAILIVEIIIVAILNSKIKKVTRYYGSIMSDISDARDERIKNERYEAYERFINNR